MKLLLRRVLQYLGWAFSCIALTFINTNIWAVGYSDGLKLGPQFMGLLWTPIDFVVWFGLYSEHSPSLNWAAGLLWCELFLTSLIWAIFLLGKRRGGKDTFGTSRFLKTSELGKLGAFHPGRVIVGQTDEAVFKSRLGRDAKGETIQLWKMLRPGRVIYNSEPTHYLVVASTSSGKDQAIILPTLLNNRDALFIYDIKKEAWDKTAAWRSTFTDVVRFEPETNDTPRWNPLYEIAPGEHEIDEAMLIGQMLQSSTPEKDEDYWSISSAQLLTMHILYVLYNPDIEEKDLYMVYFLMNHPQKDRETVLNEILGFPETDLTSLQKKTVEAFKMIARGALGMSNNERSGVYGTSNAKVQFAISPNIRRATSASDFSIRSLVYEERPKSLYFIVSPGRADLLRPLTRLFLLFLGQKLTTDTVTTAQKRHRLFLVLNEFASLGYMPFIETQIAYFRGYGLQFLFAIQSLNQLYRIYGERTSIPDNCRLKAFLGVETPKEAEEVAGYLGVQTVTRESEGQSQNSAAVMSTSTSQGLSDGSRQLMTPDEIYRLDFDKMILLWSRQFPYVGRKIMAYLDPRFLKNKHKEVLPDPNDIAVQRKFLSRVKNPWAFTSAWKNRPSEKTAFEREIEAELRAELDRDEGNDYSIMERS